MNPFLEEVLARPANLPTVPEVVREVMESFGDDNVTVETLSRSISMDPVIAAKLLRLANSAFYRAQRKILSVDECLLLLGMTTVRNVVLGCGLKDAYAPLPGFDLRLLWRHSVQTACAARWLARALGLDGELAFTTGLMQGIGQLILYKAMPDRVRQIDAVTPAFSPERAATEMRALHFHHGEVSAGQAQRWNLPDTIVSTLRAAPLPQSDPDSPRVAGCVHLASWAMWRARELADQPGNVPKRPPDAAQDSLSDAQDPLYPAAVADGLGLHWAWWPEALDGIAPRDTPLGRKGRLAELSELTLGLEELLN